MTDQTSRPVCSTGHLYHYFISGDPPALEAICETGLQPLSTFPESERWKTIEAAQPGVFERLYNEFAAPVLRRPYQNSGVFFTPIDFRRIEGSELAGVPRLVLPTGGLDPDWCALTYFLNRRRICRKISASDLEETRRLWPEGLVVEWFGRDRNRLFYFVPQVACYQPDGVEVRPEYFEPAR